MHLFHGDIVNTGFNTADTAENIATLLFHPVGKLAVLDKLEGKRSKYLTGRYVAVKAVKRATS